MRTFKNEVVVFSVPDCPSAYFAARGRSEPECIVTPLPRRLLRKTACARSVKLVQAKAAFGAHATYFGGCVLKHGGIVMSIGPTRGHLRIWPTKQTFVLFSIHNQLGEPSKLST